MNASNISKLVFLGVCVATAAGLGSVAGAQADSPPDVPVSLRAPAGQKVILQAHASGAQIYVCQAGADGKPQWMLKAPETELRDNKGGLIGHHYAGPTWKHEDGSEVVGKVKARVDSPDSGSIPWLLLTAIGHSGGGVLSRVASVQRVRTAGGQPPATPCDASKSGAEVRIPYMADYYFYAP